MSIRNKLLNNRMALGVLSSGQIELVFLPFLACRAGSERRESPYSQRVSLYGVFTHICTNTYLSTWPRLLQLHRLTGCT